MHWVIGDIHGMLAPLETLLEAVAGRDRAAQLIFVGDYINRGPEARRVVDRVLSLPGALCLRGNHDDVFDLCLHGACYDPQRLKPIEAFAWFASYGLDKTLLSYGVKQSQIDRVLKKRSATELAELLEVVPESHRLFFQRLGAVVQKETFFVGHAMWGVEEPVTDPDLAARIDREAPLRHRWLWGRYDETQVQAEKPWSARGFFGHTAVVNYRQAMDAGQAIPVRGPKLVLLDTAAALAPWGRLTAYCVETDEYVQADPKGKLLPQAALSPAAR